MRASHQFEDGSVLTEARIDVLERQSRIDIKAVEDGSHQIYLIECKTSSPMSSRLFEDFARQLERYSPFFPGSKLILAIATRVAPEYRELLKLRGIELWDLDEIARRFKDYLTDVQHPVLRPLLLGIASLHNQTAAKTPEALLSEELTALISGKETWSAYQRLTGRILERLFVPPLNPPLTEDSDEEGRNRRDIILPNYAESGFWAYLRMRYAADFVVADAKNYTDEIGKNEALSLLHYLKEDGAGLFGILMTRKGASEACRHALANHWIRHGKMVICLSDEDVLQMLRLKEAGDTPETVIRQTIETFRLSL
jgi:hypothetical protein